MAKQHQTKLSKRFSKLVSGIKRMSRSSLRGQNVRVTQIGIARNAVRHDRYARVSAGVQTPRNSAEAVGRRETARDLHGRCSGGQCTRSVRGAPCTKSRSAIEPSADPYNRLLARRRRSKALTAASVETEIRCTLGRRRPVRISLLRRFTQPAQSVLQTNELKSR